MGAWSSKNSGQKEDEAVRNGSLSQKSSLIGDTIVINGEIESEEEIIIEGRIEGFIRSKGLVIVEKKGVVDAEIDASEVVVIGKVNGNVTGIKKVEIKPNGEVNGNIKSQRVVLAEGAVFKGNIDMSSRDK